MKLEAKSAQMVFRDVRLNDTILLDEVAFQADETSAIFKSGTKISAKDVNIHIVLSESRLNEWIKTMAFGNIGDLQITLNSNYVTVKGKYVLFRSLKVPFQLDAKMEASNEELIRINPIALKCLGFQLPQGTTEYLINNINERMKDVLHTKSLPFPIQVKSIEVHPGRMDVDCVTSISLNTLKSNMPIAAIKA